MADVPSPERVSATGSATEGSSTLGIRRSELLLEQRAGNTGEKTRRRRKETAETNEYVNIPDEVRAGYKRFLTDHLIALQRVDEKNQHALDNPLFKHDGRLFELFYDKANKRVKESEIDAFLTRPEGYMVATQLIENQMQLEMFALSVQLSVEPPGTRNDFATNVAGRRLGWNQGVFQRIFRPGMQNPGDPLPHPGILGAFDQGSTYDILANPTMFNELQNNPAAADYIFQTTGLQIKDYVHHPATPGNPVAIPPIPPSPEHVSINTARVKETTTDPNKLREEIMDHFKARNAFLDSLGVDRRLRDASPVSFLYSGSIADAPEKLGLVYEQRVMDKWKPNDPTHPGFVANDRDGNIRRYMEAQSSVMTDMIKEYLERKKEPQEPFAEVKVKLDEKIKERKDNPEQAKEKVAAANKKKVEEITKDEGTLSTEKTPFETYTVAQKSIEDVIKNFNNEFPGYAGDIKRAISERQGKLNPRTRGSLEYQLARVYTEAASRARREVNGLTSTGDKLRSEARLIEREAERTADQKAQKLRDQIAEVKEELRKLTELQNRFFEAQKSLDDSSQSTRNLDKKLTDFTKARDTLNTWLIDDTILANSSVDQVIEYVNNQNALTGGADGWPEDQNQDPTRRQLVLEAILDAKAEASADRDPSRGTRVTAYDTLTDPHTFNLTSNQLRTKSDIQIEDLLNAHGRWTGTLGDIQAAQWEANERVRLRIDVNNELAEQLDKQKQAEQRAIDTVNLEAGTNTLEVARDLVDRYENKRDELMSAAWNVTDNQSRYTDRTTVGASEPGYTTEEQKAAKPKGYYEILNLLFAYQNRPDREAYFKKISQVVDDKRLSLLLNDNLNLHMIAHRDDLERTLRSLNREIGAHHLDSRDIARAFNGIIDSLQKQAMALP